MNDVWASYDAKNYSLKEISLSIDRGTNYAIVGQSGSGKSTLLKLINGPKIIQLSVVIAVLIPD